MSFWYPWFKLVVWILLAAWIGKKIKPAWAFGFLAVFGTIQALVGVAQFVAQGDLGLQLLGESVLSPLNRDVARTFVEGGRLLRAYGTFPHPNILAAFLVLSLLSLYYFFIVNKNKTIVSYLLTILLFINWLGLLLTFSRSGWLVAIITTVLFLTLHRLKQSSQIAELMLIVTLILPFLTLFFYWAIFPRLEFYDRFSITNRLSDYQYAWQKIQERPFFGHGLTLTMGERPIHNLYLTIWTETGSFGLLSFLSFVIWIFSRNWKIPACRQAGKIGNFNSERSVLLLMFVALLLLGIFDHFLWTLRPGLAMFWLVAGLLTFGPRS